MLSMVLCIENFLGLIELLSHWDPILMEHVLMVEESQKRVKDCKYITSHMSPQMNTLQNVLILLSSTSWDKGSLQGAMQQ